MAAPSPKISAIFSSVVLPNSLKCPVNTKKHWENTLHSEKADLHFDLHDPEQITYLSLKCHSNPPTWGMTMDMKCTFSPSVSQCPLFFIFSIFFFFFFYSPWCHRGVHFLEASMPYTPHFQKIQWSNTEHSVKSYWSGWSWKIFCTKSYKDLTGYNTQSNKLIQKGNRICFPIVSEEGLKIVLTLGRHSFFRGHG